ncbi:hypothetical protein GQ53DRAFT_828907 [Thozetella sp. PMI_491]|nr:hypothetical protein GQ53DRAFT_828907 [Thozetella sp. PMI_491]
MQLLGHLLVVAAGLASLGACGNDPEEPSPSPFTGPPPTGTPRKLGAPKPSGGMPSPHGNGTNGTTFVTIYPFSTTKTITLKINTTVPASCTHKIKNKTIKPSCFTATTTVTVPPKHCPKTTPICTNHFACPLYIKEKIVKVPCSTDCCPLTATKTKLVEGKCAPTTCVSTCVIPTDTMTVTTGCPNHTTKTSTVQVLKTVTPGSSGSKPTGSGKPSGPAKPGGAPGDDSGPGKPTGTPGANDGKGK